jgi:hypothetical protein
VAALAVAIACHAAIPYLEVAHHAAEPGRPSMLALTLTEPSVALDMRPTMGEDG